LFGPIVDRSCNRVFGGQFHEAQRDRELADQYHRPGPQISRSGRAETEVEQLKSAGKNRDVADAGGKAAELSDSAIERLPVAEMFHTVVGRSAAGLIIHSHTPSESVCSRA